jgi:hypothetical protein
MDALASPLQELADGSFGAQGAEELDVRTAGSKQHLLHALITDHLAMNGLGSQGCSIFLGGGIQVGHGDPHVIDVQQDRRSFVVRCPVFPGAAGLRGGRFLHDA